MIRKVVFSFLILSVLLGAANAQPAGGTYKGQVQLTKDVERIPGADLCRPTGTKIEFRLSGATISVLFLGPVFSGPLAGDGTFRISARLPARGHSGWIVLNWTGAVTGASIEGNSSSVSPGRSCYHSFAAKK
jgi:hypothetical protein